MNNHSVEKKSAPFISWLGLGFSLVFLILSIMSAISTNSQYLFISLLTFGGCFWILGLIFSISGLNVAIKNNRSKWSGWSGIIFSVLSILTFILSVIMPSHDNDFYHPMTSCDSDIYSTLFPSDDDNETVSASNTNYHVIITIPAYGKIKCLDNRKGANSHPANLSKYSSDFRREISTWLQLNKINPNDSILIVSERNTDYSDVVTVIDNLKKIGYNNYTVESKKK